MIASYENGGIGMDFFNRMNEELDGEHQRGREEPPGRIAVSGCSPLRGLASVYGPGSRASNKEDVGIHVNLRKDQEAGSS